MQGKAVEIRRFRSIHHIREEDWDSLLDHYGPLQSHRFLGAMEDARVENADFWYLLFLQDGELIGSAALSAFQVALDLLAEGSDLPWLDRIRARYPNFLRPRVLFCGLPISVGSHHLVVAQAAWGEAIIRALTREMERIARSEGIDLLVAKEFKEPLPPYLTTFTELGYFRAPSLPYMRMALPWASFEGWIRAMRHGYRRHVRKTLAANGWHRPVICRPGDPFNREDTALRLGGGDLCPPDRFHPLYDSVMRRAPERLEWLELDFFRKVYPAFADRLQILTFQRHERQEATALLLPDKHTLTFLLVGMEDPRGKPSLPYLNLMIGMVSLAIEEGYQWLNLGQTATWAKQQLGAETQEVCFFFRARRPWLHFLLQRGKSRFFPARQLPNARVFRSS